MYQCIHSNSSFGKTPQISYGHVSVTEGFQDLFPSQDKNLHHLLIVVTNYIHGIFRFRPWYRWKVEGYLPNQNVEAPNFTLGGFK
jgi:hypothetical protein